MALIGSCLLLLLVAACSQPQTANDEPDKTEVEEHRDQWRPREAQSDFLELVHRDNWLSFVQRDQQEYPEHFEGLDRDQKRRLRLAPKGSDKQVLIQFDLPQGGKLWPVDWYGIELMAIDLPGDSALHQYSVALMNEDSGGPRHSNEPTLINAYTVALSKIRARYESVDDSNWFTLPALERQEETSGVRFVDGEDWTYGYAAKRLTGRTGSWVVAIESRVGPTEKGVRPPKTPQPLLEILDGISIKREIALEGSPKHKCTSTLEEQLSGTLRFPDGTLKLPVSKDMLVRKIGGDSTIQIDGHGAEPWLLIRRLKESDLPGDLRVRVRADTTFARRLKQPGAKFSAGYSPGWNFPAVLWDYSYSGGEQIILGVIVVGKEFLTLEVISTGLHDGEARHKAKQAALDLFNGANTAPIGDRKPLEPLIGWNIGTMGRDE